MKHRKTPRLIALFICVLLAFEALAIAPVYAEEQGESDTIMQVPNGYDKLEAATLYKDKKLTLSDESKASVSADNSCGGIILSGKADELSALKLSLTDELDFGDMKLSQMVVNAVAPRKTNAKLKLFIDGAEEAAATVTLPRQNKKGSWTVSKNFCADLSALNLSGKHTVAFSVVFDESLGSSSTSVLLRSVFFTAQTVPVVNVNIDESEGTIVEMNADENHEAECCGNITINVPKGYKSEYSDKEYKSGTYELEYIRGRGNSTWGTSKKPYKLKLEKKQDFFGMGANKHWILLANYYDYTMLRNKYTYWLSEAMGMEYSPQCVFIDLVMNGQYLGSYYLCEQVRVGKSRVDIDDLEDTPELSEGDDISGGYLLSLGSEEGEHRMIDSGKLSFLLENPDFTDYYNEAQYNYISDYLKKTDEAVNSSTFRDKDGVHYSEYLDVDAAIGYYMVQEFSINGDAFSSGSTYLYKKRGGKLYWGPLWDFDYVAWGATEFGQNLTDGFHFNTTSWFNNLFTDPDFVAKFKARWQQLKPIIEASIEDGGQIDTYARQLYMSQKANYYAADTVYNEGGGWDDYAAKTVEPVGTGEPVENVEAENTEEYVEPAVVNYDSEVKRFKDWIRERIEWVDENIDSIAPVKYSVTFKSDGKVYSEGKFFGDDYYQIMPTEPVKKNYKFLGWYTKSSGYEESIYDYEFNSEQPEVVFYAKWKKLSASSGIKKIVFPFKDIYIYGGSVDYTGNVYTGGDSFDTYTLPITVMPFDCSTDSIVWTVSNSKAATISNGEITPLVNKADVKVTAKLGKLTTTCTVHIGGDEGVFDDDLLKKNITLTQGAYSRVELKDPPKALISISDVKFYSSNTRIISVDDYGFIYAKKAGTACVAVSCFNDKLQFCNITVKSAPIKKGDKVSVGGLRYKVTAAGKKRTVTLLGAVNKKVTSIKIPASVKLQGKKYSVTAIASKAFKDCSKLRKVSVLAKTIKRVGANAFNKANKKLRYTFPKAVRAKYRKLFKVVSGK